MLLESLPEFLGWTRIKQEMESRISDLSLAFILADIADNVTLKFWSPHGVPSKTKADGTLVTLADSETEDAVLKVLETTRPDDGFLGEEIGSRTTRYDRRWIVDGIDGTNGFVAGLPDWGTLIALEQEGEIALGMISSPAQDKRWWAQRGCGAFTGTCDSNRSGRPIRVSTNEHTTANRVATLPLFKNLAPKAKLSVENLLSGNPSLNLSKWSQQMKVADGELDACIWFCGDTWDHAAPAIIVQEAGGRFSDHSGGSRLDTRTGLYSNSLCHNQILNSLSKFQD
jgi:histidinol-phosphatase